MREGLEKTRIFLEMIKFEHSIFALPFAYLGLILAVRGVPSLPLFLKVTLAMVSFRTLAMAVNRILDAKIDAQNPRTQNRAIPAKKLKKEFVWACAFISLFIFELAAYFLNPLCFQLSPICVFLAVFYPFTKRFTWFSHLVLGIILGIAPYGAWLAAGREFSWVPAFFTFGVTSWVAGFDIIYALQDASFDRNHQLHSVPAVFGEPAAISATRILHIITVAAWSAAGYLAGLKWIYAFGIVIVAVFLIREHWLIHTEKLKKIDEAFFTMNAFVSVAVMLAVVLDLFLERL